MTDEAWPFLIGRTGTEDYRVVVAPGFMTGGKLAGMLRTWADGDPQPPDMGYVRALPAESAEPVTLVYRVLVPHPHDYGLPGDRPLTDRYGRPIVMTEGIALRRPERAVAAKGVNRADFDRAHAAVVPAYQDFWRKGRNFRRSASEPFTLASPGPDESRLTLKQAPIPARREASSMGDAPVSAKRVASDASMKKRRRVRTVPLLAAAIVAVVATTITATAITLSLRSSPRSQPKAAWTTTLNDVCRLLLAGRPERVYGLTTLVYQRGTSASQFTARVLSPGNGPATQCTTWTPTADGTTHSAIMVITQRHGSVVWLLHLTGESAWWRISGLSLIAATQP
jgi:hypothetical protein